MFGDRIVSGEFDAQCCRAFYRLLFLIFNEKQDVWKRQKTKLADEQRTVFNQKKMRGCVFFLVNMKNGGVTSIQNKISCTIGRYSRVRFSMQYLRTSGNNLSFSITRNAKTKNRTTSTTISDEYFENRLRIAAVSIDPVDRPSLSWSKNTFKFRIIIFIFDVKHPMARQTGCWWWWRFAARHAPHGRHGHSPRPGRAINVRAFGYFNTLL